MKKTKIMRLMAFVCTLILVTSTFVVAGGAFVDGDSQEYLEEQEYDIVLVERVDQEDISLLNRLDVEIIDRYGSYVLLDLQDESVERLEKGGLQVNTLPGRTQVSVKGHLIDIRDEEPLFELKDGSEIDSSLMIDEYEPGTEGIYIVHMLGPINPEWRQTLEKNGIEIINYVPNYAYEVSMTPEQAERVEDLFFVDWVGIYQPGYKLHPRLEEAVDMGMPINVRLRPGFDRTALTTFDSRLNIFNEEDLREDGYRLTIDVNSMEQLEDLAMENDVYYIRPYIEPELHAEMDIQLIGGGQWFMDDEYPTNEDLTPPPRQGDPQEPYRLHGDYGAYMNQLGYLGEGITITTADTGVGDGTVGDAGVEDFTGRVIGGYGFGADETNWADGHYHGTACTGLIVGDTHHGTGDIWSDFQDGDMDYYMGQGLAAESEIFGTKIFDDGGGFMPTEYYPIVEEPAQRSDAYIHSNSWGAGTMGDYIDTDEIFDQAVRDADRDTDENRPMVITVSAGNDGGRGDYSQETGSPGNAKNVITVGGNQPYNPGLGYNNPENMYGSSSRGWTEDNRIKPDVIAPSESVISQNTPLDGGGYVAASGTSFGNPLAAGAATIVVDWYEQNYEETPSPAMVKAILINTANQLDPEVGDTGSQQDSDGYVPNRDEGWGVPDISKLEYPIDNPIGFEFSDQETLLTTGDVEEYTINYQDEDEPLKITLTWTDKNALDGDSSGGTPTLKNNLNLEVETPGGEIIRGNAFDQSGDGHSDDGFTYPDAEVMADFDYNDDGWDDVNNVQNVFINPEELETGSYTVRVLGTNIPEDANNDGEANQDYALSVYNVPDVAIPDKDGEIMFEYDEYPGDGLVNITLTDVILEGEGTHDISVASMDADGDELENITVTLDEDQDNLGVFYGSVQLTEDDTADGLYVEHDGEIIGWYWDEDPGHPDDLELDGEMIGLTEETLQDGISIAVVDETDYWDGEIADILSDYLPDDIVVDTLEADELIGEMENYEGFVVWRFGSDSLAQDFLDELTDDQGVVYLDSYEGFTSEAYGDAVTRLHNIRGDPGDHWSGSGTSSPVEIVINEEHEIFEDIGEVGDIVEMMPSGTIWGSWYDDYSGDDLALVQYDGEDEGQGVGIDEDNNEILMTAVNIDMFAAPEDWTEEAWTLLANSVEFIAAERVLQITSPPSLVNSIDAHPVEVLVNNIETEDATDVPVEVTIYDDEMEEEYFDETTIDVDAEDEVLVEFDDWEPSEEGEFLMNVTTTMHGEEHWETRAILVDNVDDVGVIDIISPTGRVLSNQIQDVEGEIENFGNVPQVDVPVEAFISEYIYLVDEDFEEEIPADWTIDNTTEEPYTWHHDGDMAYVEGNADIVQDEWLISPTIDLTDAEGTALEFDHDFSTSSFSGDSWGRVHLSNDGGDSWELIEEWEAEESESGVFEYDISGIADGEEEVQVAFEWDSPGDVGGNFDDWEIYEVSISYIDEEYSDETTVDVEAGDTAVATFADWDPSDVGTYFVNFTTDLDGDVDPTNDYETGDVTVEEPIHDIGVDEIINPESEVWNETQPVNANVSNYGDFDEVDVPVQATAERIIGVMEDFSGDFPPAGWETDDWEQSGTSNAGGEPPEAMVTWTGIEGDYAYLQTPASDTSDAEELTLEFKSYINHFTDTFNARVLARSTSGEEWSDITPWANPITGNVGPDTYEVDITDHIGPGTQIMFEFEGDSWNINQWYVDDVMAGYTEEDYFDEVMVDLDMDETATVDFADWTPTAAGNYIFNVTALHPEDENPENATLLKGVYARPIIIDLEATSIDAPEEPIYQFEEDVLGTVTHVGNYDVTEDTPVNMTIEPIHEDIPIDEDFSEGLPVDWAVEDRDGNDNTWEWSEDDESMIITPEDEHENDVLWTEVADCSMGEYTVTLEFYSSFAGENDRDLLLSTDGGVTYRKIGRNIGEGHLEYDITQWASEEAAVMIGWEFYTDEPGEDEYWEIDDVKITNEYTTEEYHSTAIIEELNATESIQLEFDTWAPAVLPSDYLITMTTNHPEDDNLENTEISERVFAREYIPVQQPIDPSPYDGEEGVTHSPLLNATVLGDEEMEFDATIYLYDDEGNEIGNETVTGLQSGERATAQFFLLETNSTFHWNVSVEDGISSNMSETWTFHTYVPEGMWKTASASINAEPPAPVENLAVDWDADFWDVEGNELTWDASPDDGAGADDTDHYVIYRAEDETGPWDETTIIDTVNADGSMDYMYFDEGMADDGEQWHYVVRAVDRVGNMEMNEDYVSELPLPYAEDPDPESGTVVEDMEQTVSVEIVNPTDEQLNVEFYHGRTREVFEEFDGITSGTLEADYPELDEEDMGQDHYWFVVTSYEDYNVGRISPREFILDVDIVGGGTVEIDPEQEYYFEGTEVELTAIADEDWTFVNWTGDYEGTEEEITITMDWDKEITANFEYEGDLVGEWRYLYEGPHRPETADNALAAANPQVWYGAMILDLSDDVGGYITDVAYFDYDAAANYVQAHVAEEDGGAPGEWISSSDEYIPVGGETWAELELNEPVEIEAPGEYWIVLEIDDPAGDNEFTFGTIDPDVNDGQWINFGAAGNPGDWDDMASDYGIYTAWGLEAHLMVPEDGDGLYDNSVNNELMSDGNNVAVVDADNYHDYEIEYKLEDYLPEDEYNVETLWNENGEHWDDWLIAEMSNYDTFVIQRFEYTNADSEAAAQDFLEELEDGQGVVYLDTHVGGTQQAYSDGVTRLHHVRGDPGFHDSESLGTDPPQYLEILEDHPIFEGVGDAGDEVLIYDGTTNWASWFDDYTGESIGHMDYGGGYEGYGVGVCDDRNEVLLPAKGIGFFGTGGDPGWTEEANQLFANAVEYVAGEIEFEPMGWHFHLLDTVDPVADAGEDMEAWQGETVTLNGTGSTDNVGIDVYEWTIEDPMGEETVLYGPYVNYTLEYALNYDVNLTVYDEAGNYDSDTMEIYAIDTEDPVADAGWAGQTRVGFAHELNGTASTDNVGIVSYSWTIEGVSGDAEGYVGYADGAVVEYVFDYAGTYEATLEVEDAEGNSDTDTVSIIVNPPLDVVEIIWPEYDYQVIDIDTFTVEWENLGYVDDVTYEVRIDYDEWIDVGTNTYYTILQIEDGNHILEVRARDQADNTYTTSRIFTIDTIEEEIEIISPEDGVESLTYDEEFTIIGQTDPQLDVYINGVSVDVDEQGEFEYTTTLVEGQNVFRVIAEYEGEKVAETTVYALYLPMIQEMQDAIEDLEYEIAQNRDAIEDLEDVTDQLQIDISDLEDELNAEVDRLENALYENVSALEDAILENKTELIDIINDNIDSIYDELDDINQDISTIYDELDAINTSIADIQDQVDMLESDMDALETDLQGQIDTLSSDLDTIETDLQGQINDLESDMALLEIDLQNQIDNLASDMENLETMLQDQIDDLESDMDALETDLQNQIDTLEDDMDALETDLQGQIDTLDSNIDTLETDLQDQIDDLESDLQGQISSLRTDLEDQIGDLESDLQGQIDTLESDLQHQIDLLETDLQNQITNMETNLQNQLDTLQAGLQDLIDTVESEQEELENMISDLENDLQDQINDLETNLQEFEDEQEDVDEDQDAYIDMASNLGIVSLILAILAIIIIIVLFAKKDGKTEEENIEQEPVEEEEFEDLEDI